MASASSSASCLSDELRSVATTSPSQDFDQESSISSHVSGISVNNELGNHGEVDHLIQLRIKKIYTRLKETDANIKTMETLLDWKRGQSLHTLAHPIHEEAQQGNHHTHRRITSSKPERRLSASSQSSLDVFEHSRGNSGEKNEMKSAESLRLSGPYHSPTLKQLQRLTQSMQDLHNFQQRFQEDLKMEVRNISRNERHDVLNELSLFIQKQTEENFSCKDVMTKLLDLQKDLKTSQNQDDFRTHVLLSVEKVKEEMEKLKLLLQKLSSVESQQGKLERTIEVLVKQMEIRNQVQSTMTSQDIVGGRHMDAQVEDLQQQIEKNVRLSLETSRQIHQMSEEFQRIQLGRNSTGSERDSGKHKAKQVVNKLRARCEALEIEKRHFEDMGHASEERVHALLREKEALLMQLEDFQNKLHHAHTELQSIKASCVDDQMENWKKETTLQQFKFLYDKTLTNLASCNEELEQMKVANKKLSDENGTLHQEIVMLRRERQEQQDRITLTSNSLQELKTSGTSAKHLEEKVAFLNARFEEAKELHTKQMNEEKGNHRLLSQALSDIKANSIKEIADAALRKEAEFKPIIAMLKQQISDYQIQINNLQQENKNIVSEKSHMNRELLKIQSEIRDAHKKHEKLVKNYYSKDEALRLKIHQIEAQELTLADFRKVARKMEQEYKTILSTINAEVDHLLQLWNKASSCKLQVLTPANRSPVHPKVQLVDIQSKLKWMQDDLCSLVTTSERISDTVTPTKLPKTSVGLNKVPSNNIAGLSKLGISSGNFPRETNLVQDNQKMYTLQSHNLPSLNLSQIAKDWEEVELAENLKGKKDSDPGTKYFENNFKQLNSTEIDGGNTLPINQLSSLCRNDIHAAKKNVGSQHQFCALSPHFSSITEPSDDMSTDNQLDCRSSQSD